VLQALPALQGGPRPVPYFLPPRPSSSEQSPRAMLRPLQVQNSALPARHPTDCE
jgi:hypothetical protein